MKFTVQKPFSSSAELFVRRAGYGKITDRATGKESYVYRLSRTAFYPRFHVYISEDQTESVMLDLHFDQKQPSYEGAHMHSGEYEGEMVEKEAERIAKTIAAVISV